MAARILDGAALARRIRDESGPAVREVSARLGRPPRLGIVLVGDDPGSEIYVRNKLRAAEESGILAELVRLPRSAPLDVLLDTIRRLNRSDDHDGILVQLPLPAAMGAGAARAVFDTISPAKDVDGCTPVNVGRLVQNRALFAPCTPSGVIELLDRNDIEITGASAVVLGRSEIVGKPMALLLLHRDATVTICHSRTRELAAIAARADILVCALGHAGFVTPDFIKPGATVVDVGVNRITDRTVAARLFASAPERLAQFERQGSAIVGDVHPGGRAIAGALTPVPGGVGPLTIAMLLRNTLRAAGETQAQC